MTSRIIVEIEVFGKGGFCFRNRCVGFEIYLLVFDGAPEAFNEDIISPPPLAIHADGDLVAL